MARIDAGQTKLAHSMKSLRESWDVAQEHWRDRVRVEFEEKYLREMEDRVRSTLGAMERLAELLNRAERDCRTN